MRSLVDASEWEKLRELGLEDKFSDHVRWSLQAFFREGVSATPRERLSKVADAHLQSLYEKFPYPPRLDNRPLDSMGYRPLRECQPPIINEAIYSGGKDFRDGKVYRILVAGGGTGDPTMSCAESFRSAGFPYEIVHLDLSRASIDIAKARVQTNCLVNVTFVQASILDIFSLHLGKFDFIHCTGVLTNTYTFDAGLSSLKSVLHESGGMHLWVYAPYGRHGVYEIQSAMKILFSEDDMVIDWSRRLEMLKRVLKGLPATHWLKKNDLIGKILSWEESAARDVRLADTFLYPSEVALLAHETVSWVNASRMCVNDWINREDYKLDITDELLHTAVSELSTINRIALGEALRGDVVGHRITVVHQENKMQCLEEREMHNLQRYSDQHAGDIPMCSVLCPAYPGFPGHFHNPLFAGAFRADELDADEVALLRLVDCHRTVAEIFSHLMQCRPWTFGSMEAAAFGQYVGRILDEHRRMVPPRLYVSSSVGCEDGMSESRKIPSSTSLCSETPDTIRESSVTLIEQGGNYGLELRAFSNDVVIVGHDERYDPPLRGSILTAVEGRCVRACTAEDVGELIHRASASEDVSVKVWWDY